MSSIFFLLTTLPQQLNVIRFWFVSRSRSEVRFIDRALSVNRFFAIWWCVTVKFFSFQIQNEILIRCLVHFGLCFCHQRSCVQSMSNMVQKYLSKLWQCKKWSSCTTKQRHAGCSKPFPGWMWQQCINFSSSAAICYSPNRVAFWTINGIFNKNSNEMNIFK